ncbi:MAG: hypothetical protein KHZ62_09690 [Clostridiales bacterium]|nr:hypothetical protein [Clostridiales bacterium]
MDRRRRRRKRQSISAEYEGKVLRLKGYRSPSSQSPYRERISSHQQRNISQSRPRRVKIRRQHRGHNHRLVTCLFFFGLIIYLCGSLVTFLVKNHTGVEMVGYGTIDTPTQFTGLIVRQEKTITAPRDGQPYFNYAENEKVAMGSAVCSIKNMENTQVIEDELKKIDKSILEIQKSRGNLSAYSEDVNRIEDMIAQTCDTYITKFISGNVNDIYSFRSQIESQMNQRNDVWFQEEVKSTENLTAERSQYQEQLKDNQSIVTATDSGIFSFYVDGQEERYTLDQLSSVTEEDIANAGEEVYISKSIAVAQGDPLFKLVTDNRWAIVGYVENDMASGWKVGDHMTLSAQVDEEEKDVPVTVKEVDAGKKSTRVVFESDWNMIDFLSLRKAVFSVKTDAIEGLKIPNEAIVEKTMLKIPSDCIQESADKLMVIKRENGVDTSIEINLLDRVTSEENSLKYDGYVAQDFSTLKIGDVLLTNGGEGTYTISEVATFKGVYVANSTVAKFKVVDILGSNENYSIVDGNSLYGIKVYDSIVSDAKSVSENDVIY